MATVVNSAARVPCWIGGPGSGLDGLELGIHTEVSAALSPILLPVSQLTTVLFATKTYLDQQDSSADKAPRHTSRAT